MTFPFSINSQLIYVWAHVCRYDWTWNFTNSAHTSSSISLEHFWRIAGLYVHWNPLKVHFCLLLNNTSQFSLGWNSLYKGRQVWIMLIIKTPSKNFQSNYRVIFFKNFMKDSTTKSFYKLRYFHGKICKNMDFKKGGSILIFRYLLIILLCFEYLS